MELDKLQFKASVRTGWQAIDLGFLMASRWWQTLFFASAIPALLLFIPLLIIFLDQPYWAVFIIWWLKPFWERMPLFIASRKIFSENAFDTAVVSSLKTVYKKDFLPWLLWRRFSFYRAFDAPVTVLEDLKGKPRKQRLAVLHGKHTDIALSNQLVCFCCELIVASGLFAILIFLTPSGLSEYFYDEIEDFSLVGEWLFSLCAFLAITVLMPFHSMAGFALYLNRRIELEAWDIEITFRSLAQRKLQSIGNLLASVLLTLGIMVMGQSVSSSAYAASKHDSESAKTLITEVLKGEDFGQERVAEKWRFKNWAEENEDKIPDWMIDFVEWWENNIDLSEWQSALSTTAFWIKAILIGLFIYLLVYLFYKFRGPLKSFQRGQKAEAAPETMFGLDVRAESLPEDVPAQVMQLWRDGKQRDAMSLLYRASLSRLIEQHALAFKSSHTEAECAALVQAYGIESLSYYFSQLTRVWRRLAYGHEAPESSTLQQLCDSWSKEMTDVAR